MGERPRASRSPLWIRSRRSADKGMERYLSIPLSALRSAKQTPPVNHRGIPRAHRPVPKNPQRRPALGIYRQLEPEIDCARFADAQVAPVLRLRARCRRLPTVPEGCAGRQCAACTPARGSESEARQREAASPGPMKPASRLELSRGPLDAPKGCPECPAAFMTSCVNDQGW